jgi:muramoyltetrapeptide carboxypeptidase
MIAPAFRPPAVRPGDRVGVAALSSPVDRGLLAAGLSELVRLGFEPVLAANLERRDRIFAGSDAERLAGFTELVDDPSLKAIFFARGGHGLVRLLDAIDWARLAAHPRAYIGYSDLTPLLGGLVERCGLSTLHGPMVVSDLARGLDAGESRSLLDALAGESALEFDLEGVEGEGEVEGVLLGGCLSLFSSTLGTPHALSLADSVLFLEDVDEPLYRLDRMLTQLKLSGSLDRVRAMIFGTSIAPGNIGPWLDLARDAAPGALLAHGLSSGHVRPNFTLPLGLVCRLDAAARRLTVGAA